VTPIYFRTRQQIIECADAIPRAPGGEGFAHQHLLIARVIVLCDADAPARFQLLIHILQAFALADRIEDQHHVALPRQALREGLIRLARLAVV
jgi:hypothetical protein